MLRRDRKRAGLFKFVIARGEMLDECAGGIGRFRAPRVAQALLSVSTRTGGRFRRHSLPLLEWGSVSAYRMRLLGASRGTDRSVCATFEARKKSTM